METTGRPGPLASPFSPIMAVRGAALPPAFREQFLLSPEAPYRLVLAGCMDRVWHRPRWLWPLFRALAWTDTLFAETGEDVPATMTIAAGRDRDGGPYQTWRRTFSFRTPRRFNATLSYDRRLGAVVEWLGAAKRVAVVWELRFPTPLTLEIVTAGWALRLGRRLVRLPRPLGVAVRAAERDDAGRDDLIHIDLTVAHPLLGPLFGYAGTFQLRRRDLRG